MAAFKRSSRRHERPDLASSRLLVVPRPVRDFVRSQLTTEELATITRRAATIYFGDRWQEGSIRPVAANRLKNPTVNSAETLNANSILLSLFNQAIDSNDDRDVGTALSIIEKYLHVLMDGDHFRSIVVLCRELLPLIPEKNDDHAIDIKTTYGESLRMTGQLDQAIDVLSQLRGPEAKSDRQEIQLSLALAYQRKGMSAEAIEAAREVIKDDKSSNRALHAKAILIEEEPDSPARTEALLKHEALCRRRGANIVANNLALSRLANTDIADEKAEQALNSVLRSAQSDGDFYSSARAIVRIARLAVEQNKDLPEHDKLRLVQVYQFLFGERLSNLFDQCHDALWNVFEREGETTNLFQLFRHSSLIWRLRGNEEKETGYLKRLSSHADSVMTRDVRSLDREAAYYLIRAGSEINNTD